MRDGQAIDVRNIITDSNTRIEFDIKDIIGKLNEVCEKEILDTNNNFQVKLLFGIRSAIVHNEENKKLTSELLNYLAPIYVNILFETLNIKLKQRL